MTYTLDPHNTRHLQIMRFVEAANKAQKMRPLLTLESVTDALVAIRNAVAAPHGRIEKMVSFFRNSLRDNDISAASTQLPNLTTTLNSLAEFVTVPEYRALLEALPLLNSVGFQGQNQGIPPIEPLPTHILYAPLSLPPNIEWCAPTADNTLVVIFRNIKQQFRHGKTGKDHEVEWPPIYFYLTLVDFTNIIALKARLRDIPLFEVQPFPIAISSQHPHPHIQNGGRPCFGEAEPAILSALCRCDLVDVIHSIHAFLLGYDQSSAYSKIETFLSGKLITCPCGNRFNQGTGVECQRCGHETMCCDDCVYHCDDCDEYMCAQCHGLHETGRCHLCLATNPLSPARTVPFPAPEPYTWMWNRTLLLYELDIERRTRRNERRQSIIVVDDTGRLNVRMSRPRLDITPDDPLVGTQDPPNFPAIPLHSWVYTRRATESRTYAGTPGHPGWWLTPHPGPAPRNLAWRWSLETDEWDLVPDPTRQEPPVRELPTARFVIGERTADIEAPLNLDALAALPPTDEEVREEMFVINERELYPITETAPETPTETPANEPAPEPGNTPA